MGSIPIYVIVQQTMLNNRDRYMTKTEVAAISGLTVDQVSRVIRSAYKLGWCERLVRKLSDNAFGEGKYQALKTAYKIVRTDSWMGLMPLYRQILENEKRDR